MFLSLLTKKEKLKFLDLAVYMIDIDGKPTEVEKKLISRIYGEIGREIVEEYTFSKSDSIDDTIDYFKDANQAVKNIVFFQSTRNSPNTPTRRCLLRFTTRYLSAVEILPNE